MKKQFIWFAIFLITVAASIRVLRDAGFVSLPPNVAPIAALALFGGVYLPKRLAFMLPLGAMIISDLMIGLYEPGIMVAVYLSFAVSGLLGLWLRSRRSVPTVVGATLGSSLVFFVVTNAAVWAFDSHGLYPHTLAGLSAAFVAGLPFLKNTLLGDLGFVTVMFGTYEFALRLVSRRFKVSTT